MKTNKMLPHRVAISLKKNGIKRSYFGGRLRARVLADYGLLQHISIRRGCTKNTQGKGRIKKKLVLKDSFFFKKWPQQVEKAYTGGGRACIDGAVVVDATATMAKGARWGRNVHFDFAADGALHFTNEYHVSFKLKDAADSLGRFG